ncbi:phosphoribosyl-AMP cyclohydrolase [Secundilactobacillus similis DSM 23365 = JCM 2765]|uniref:Histidine biosynthesis bifunctional protein HisIE n=1 Tax=Secundilactobacillus similis DSM 23365 = JCM 2765 TaxID=1423804 RepID=A0A0R2FNA1_9LACO|nr:phosphoribosyl-AMP cyclohydrolase [Secundilactobacillus similis DSM 23365 = JCM 2765]
MDDNTDRVLMMAYMNAESYRRSLETKQTWFWSRSRQEYWHKGETSGNTQAIVAMQIDCDEDTLLVRVIPEGPACHTGHTSCFYRDIELD